MAHFFFLANFQFVPPLLENRKLIITVQLIMEAIASWSLCIWSCLLVKESDGAICFVIALLQYGLQLLESRTLVIIFTLILQQPLHPYVSGAHLVAFILRFPLYSMFFKCTLGNAHFFSLSSAFLYVSGAHFLVFILRVTLELTSLHYRRERYQTWP